MVVTRNLSLILVTPPGKWNGHPMVNISQSAVKCTGRIPESLLLICKQMKSPCYVTLSDSEGSLTQSRRFSPVLTCGASVALLKMTSSTHRIPNGHWMEQNLHLIPICVDGSISQFMIWQLEKSYG